MSIADNRSGERQSTSVLVVDDDPSIRRLIAAALRRNRMMVEMAAGGRDAIEKLRTHRFGLITLDLMMPSVTGWDVIEWLRLNPGSRPPSLLVISAADREVFQKLDPSMVNAVLMKPFDLDVLIGYASGAIKQRDRRRARIIGAT